MSARRLRCDLEIGTAASLARTSGFVLIATLSAWVIRALVPGASVGLLVAGLAIGLLAARLDRDHRWCDVVGALTLVGGACALGARYLVSGEPMWAWPAFAVALLGAGLRPGATLFRSMIVAMGMAVAVPGLYVLAGLDLLAGQERASLRGTLLAGLALALVGWALEHARIQLRVLGPSAPRPTVGPYRD